MISNLINPLLVGAIAAFAAGFLAVFIIFKRMTLVGDALSHVALPGIALSLILGLSPLIGSTAFLLVASFIIYWLSGRTKLYEEALVGILFAVSLAVGVLFLKGGDLEAALFGNLSAITFVDFILSLIIGAVIIVGAAALYKKLAVSSFSVDLARSHGVDVERVNFYFLILLSLAVVLGIKVLGTLLVGSLLIIPSASAQNISRSLKQMTVWSIVFSVASVLGGILLSAALVWPAGPIIVLVEGAAFVATLFFRR